MKTVIIILAVVILIGAVVGLLIWNKQNSVKPITYLAKFDVTKRAIYLVDDQGDPKNAQREVLNNITGINYFVSQVIWVTNQPNSYPTTDPQNKEIKYFTIDSAEQAFNLIRKIVLDSNWLKTTTERILFHSFDFTEANKDSIIALERDTIITHTPALFFGQIKGEQARIKAGKK